MSHPLVALRKLLGPTNSRTTGVIVASHEGVLTIDTPTGKVTVGSGGKNYRCGDTVLLNNGSIVGKVPNPATLPVYHL